LSRILQSQERHCEKLTKFFRRRKRSDSALLGVKWLAYKHIETDFGLHSKAWEQSMAGIIAVAILLPAIYNKQRTIVSPAIVSP
jgi:hypothetical protein